MSPVLSIIIVSFNAPRDLDACLSSLARHPPSLAHEILVVDNASTAGDPGIVVSRYPGVRLLRNARNEGFARANNIGIRASQGRALLLLNSDTEVPAGALDQLHAALAAWPAAAAIGPKLLDRSGRPELSWGRHMSPATEIARRLLLRHAERGRRWATRRIGRMTSARRVVDWVSGACLLVWRIDAERAGLLDERFFMYTEDVDFCASLRAQGRDVVYDPAVTVIHHGGRSVETSRAATYAAYRRSHLAFYEKHHPRWIPWLRWYLRLTGRHDFGPSARASRDAAGTEAGDPGSPPSV